MMNLGDVCLRMQLLQELSQVPCMADINYAKKASIMKRNRYKDRFPCECIYCFLLYAWVRLKLYARYLRASLTVFTDV